MPRTPYIPALHSLCSRRISSGSPPIPMTTEYLADLAGRLEELRATGLYKDGLIGFQEVLDSQRQLFRQESGVATARGQASQALVLLYRALGGGWDPDEVEQPPAQEPPGPSDS